MADIERILTGANVEYRRAPTSLDSLTANPAWIKEVNAIIARKPDEVILYADQPAGAPAPVIHVSQIKEARTIPFTGQPAVQFAQQFLQRQRVQERLGADVKTMQDAAKAKITYSAGFGPPEVPKAPGRPTATKAGAPATAKGAASAPAQAAPVPAPAGN